MALAEQPSVEIFNYSKYSFNLSELAINSYYIIFDSYNKETYISLFNEECYNCLPYNSKLVYNESVATLSSKYNEKWWLHDKKTNNLICEITPNTQEFGVYKLKMQDCELETLVDPVNIYLPILTVILIYLAVTSIIVGSIYLYNKYIKKNKNDEPEIKKQRIQSIDTFRGISIILMVLVNYGGGSYNFLEHAVWNGLTLADVVFPWFLWIMGICIPISIKSALKREDRKIFWHILKRSVILFVLGLIVNGISGKNIYYLRVFGVLQRFSLCYFIIASVCFIFMKKDFRETGGMFKDIILMLPQWICALLCLALHSGLTFGLTIPDCPVVGYLGPGGVQGDKNMSNYGAYINCTGGAAGYIDRTILGEDLMYRDGAFRMIYSSQQAVDPEGILGTLTATFQVILGVHVGIIILIYKGHSARLTRWIIWGTFFGLLAGGLCGFTQNDGVIPINKNLWSLSFVLVTTFFALIILSVLYVIVDCKKYWSGKPFIFAGMNPIILYVGQSLTYGRFPFQWGYLEPSLHFQMLSQAVWGTMCWWLVAYWLYKIKFFLSI